MAPLPNGRLTSVTSAPSLTTGSGSDCGDGSAAGSDPRPAPGILPGSVVDLEIDRSDCSRPSVFTGKRIHCIGIGGCGLSGLALMLQRLGAKCSGSDTVGGPAFERLRREAIDCTDDQSPAGLPDPCDLIIASAAIRP